MSAEPQGARGPPNISGMCSLKARAASPSRCTSLLARIASPALTQPAPLREQVDNLGYSATQEDVMEAVRCRARCGPPGKQP